MEASRKRLGSNSEDESVKRQKKDYDSESNDRLGEDLSDWLLVDDDKMSELMKLLDAEISSPSTTKVRFIENPYTSSFVYGTTSSSYVTINGNEESCGSSFSDCESSVMASVDTCGFGKGSLEMLGIGFSACGSVYGGNEGMDGSDGLEWVDDGDDELARFLGKEAFLTEE